MANTSLERAHTALKFVEDFATMSSNGEGWTYDHVIAIVAWGLGRDLDARDQMFVRNVLGPDALAPPKSADKAGRYFEIVRSMTNDPELLAAVDRAEREVLGAVPVINNPNKEKRDE